ncbi:MAG TPA: NUDIX hydrolase [Myxococcota bacterium]|nr:NUDIX hydrolase [Myxococcota bacterium]
MTEPARPEPRLAATVLLVRDGAPGLEVFMVERHHQIDFATGALVFPGGKVDPGDADPRLADRCGAELAADAPARTLRVAAIRETFEECGVLLARPRGARELVPAARLPKPDADFASLVCGGDFDLACDLLVPFAHWITPAVVPKRFDTHFFIAAAPADQLALHDGRESVDSVWIAPQAALDAAESGKRTIIFPTLMNLARLAQAKSAAEALARARTAKIVTVQPAVSRGADGNPALSIPAEAGYPTLSPALLRAGGL